ncbi:MAG: PilZ domain-containing protein [Deltaproteobacteria bacterium]|nr:PilZ domain-containing protein [Deltaproteobacteria bacterium]
MTTVQSVYPRWLRQRVELTGSLQLGPSPGVDVHVVDLSVGSAFCETERRSPAGAAARLTLDLPEGSVTVDAVVTRSGTALRAALHPELDQLVVRAPGVGLRFLSVRSETRKRLEAYLTAVREA